MLCEPSFWASNASGVNKGVLVGNSPCNSGIGGETLAEEVGKEGELSGEAWLASTEFRFIEMYHTCINSLVPCFSTFSDWQPHI